MINNLAQVLKSHAPGATGSFNILDLDMAFSIIDSAESLQMPVIIGVATRHFNDIRTPLLAPSLLKAIEAATIPAVLHLDHASPDQLDMIKQALDLGFTSIMIDGSLLPLDENIAITRKVVALSHQYGASVEGEIGGIAGEEGVADTDQDAPDEIPYTVPAEAHQFVAETNVDELAIAVGTAHGIYKSEPHINFEVIQQIAAITDIPLVMHGATGVSDASIQRAVASGVRKINYFSGLLQRAMDEVRLCNRANNDFYNHKQNISGKWQKVVTEQMRLFTRQAA